MEREGKGEVRKEGRERGREKRELEGKRGTCTCR
jgi:hypothetical protein